MFWFSIAIVVVSLQGVPGETGADPGQNVFDPGWKDPTILRDPSDVGLVARMALRQVAGQLRGPDHQASEGTCRDEVRRAKRDVYSPFTSLKLFRCFQKYPALVPRFRKRFEKRYGNTVLGTVPPSVATPTASLPERSDYAESDHGRYSREISFRTMNASETLLPVFVRATDVPVIIVEQRAPEPADSSFWKVIDSDAVVISSDELTSEYRGCYCTETAVIETCYDGWFATRAVSVTSSTQAPTEDRCAKTCLSALASGTKQAVTVESSGVGCPNGVFGDTTVNVTTTTSAFGPTIRVRRDGRSTSAKVSGIRVGCDILTGTCLGGTVGVWVDRGSKSVPSCDSETLATSCVVEISTLRGILPRVRCEKNTAIYEISSAVPAKAECNGVRMLYPLTTGDLVGTSEDFRKYSNNTVLGSGSPSPSSDWRNKAVAHAVVSVAQDLYQRVAGVGSGVESSCPFRTRYADGVFETRTIPGAVVAYALTPVFVLSVFPNITGATVAVSVSTNPPRTVFLDPNTRIAHSSPCGLQAKAAVVQETADRYKVVANGTVSETNSARLPSVIASLLLAAETPISDPTKHRGPYIPVPGTPVDPNARDSGSVSRWLGWLLSSPWFWIVFFGIILTAVVVAIGCACPEVILCCARRRSEQTVVFSKLLASSGP